MGGDFNWINNVHFNWKHRTMDGSNGGSPLNVINNYYKPGPVTNLNAPISYRIVKIEGGSGGGARAGEQLQARRGAAGVVLERGHGVGGGHAGLRRAS